MAWAVQGRREFSTSLGSYALTSRNNRHNQKIVEPGMFNFPHQSPNQLAVFGMLILFRRKNKIFLIILFDNIISVFRMLILFRRENKII